MAKRTKLVIAANRLPAHRVGEGRAARWAKSPGGLVSAMSPVLAKNPGCWVGWDGAIGHGRHPVEVDGLTLAPVRLSRVQVDTFYAGFCNGTLWPLYHDAIVTPEFHRPWWEHYRDVNAKFAAEVSRRASRRAIVWIHDYHLQLVPALLRQSRPDLRVGFFLHIPFPPEELFAWLPWRAAILRGLLGADLVAFQTEASSQNFSRAARRWTPAEGTDREVRIDSRDVRVRPMPISIDAAEMERLAKDPDVVAKSREIRQRLGDRRVILGVDRLDYTKGIPERLVAFEELLKSGRLSVEDVVMVQIAVPSREESLGYSEIRREVEGRVGRINGQFSEPGSVAVHYFRRTLSHRDLAAYYLAADVMLVTPLRDGMNLVAKEYVACRYDLSGALVLSEFAGAAWELRRALLVNPRDVEALKSVIVQALKMPPRDLRMRMSILRMQVRRHDVFEWANSFLEDLGA